MDNEEELDDIKQTIVVLSERYESRKEDLEKVFEDGRMKLKKDKLVIENLLKDRGFEKISEPWMKGSGKELFENIGKLLSLGLSGDDEFLFKFENDYYCKKFNSSGEKILLLEYTITLTKEFHNSLESSEDIEQMVDIISRFLKPIINKEDDLTSDVMNLDLKDNESDEDEDYDII